MATLTQMLRCEAKRLTGGSGEREAGSMEPGAVRGWWPVAAGPALVMALRGTACVAGSRFPRAPSPEAVEGGLREEEAGAWNLGLAQRRTRSCGSLQYDQRAARRERHGSTSGLWPVGAGIARRSPGRGGAALFQEATRTLESPARQSHAGAHRGARRALPTAAGNRVGSLAYGERTGELEMYRQGPPLPRGRAQLSGLERSGAQVLGLPHGRVWAHAAEPVVRVQAQVWVETPGGWLRANAREARAQIEREQYFGSVGASV